MRQTSSSMLSDIRTVADLLHHLGGVPAERIRFQPLPGTATEQDVLAIHAQQKRLFELVDGTLVEKPMGFYESLLAAALIKLLGNFVDEHDLGLITAPDGMMRIAPGLVRIPDVAFLSWERLPADSDRHEPIPAVVPDLVVEMLSGANTRREMERKCQEYFDAGVRLVWYLDPGTRSMEVFVSPEQSVVVGHEGTLEGGDVLPGLQLPLRSLFDWADRRAKKP